MQFQARPISFKPPRLNRLSGRLLVSHYENNYGGAVRRLNAITEELSANDPATLPGFRLNGLKREELIATNSMLLHEVYFDSLGEAYAVSGDKELAIKNYERAVGLNPQNTSAIEMLKKLRAQ